MDYGILFILLNSCKKAKVRPSWRLRLGHHLRAGGWRKRYVKKGWLNWPQREAGRIWPRTLWMEEERHCRWRRGGDETHGGSWVGDTGLGQVESHQPPASTRALTTYLSWVFPLWCLRRWSLLFSHLLWVSNWNVNSDSPNTVTSNA